MVCWQGQVGAADDDTTVALVTPAVNQSRRVDIFMGTLAGAGGWAYANGFRFAEVPVEPGARIISAWLSLRYKYHSGLPVNLHLYGEAADASLPFTDTYTLVHERSRTAASVAWPISTAPASGTWFDSPDITQLVQEIVNRPGWALYNPLSILVASDASSAQYVDVWAYDWSADLAAKLEICSQRSPGRKQGLAWVYRGSTPAQKVASTGAKGVLHWGYNSTVAAAALEAGLSYFPMQFGCAQGEASIDESAIRSFVSASPRFQGLAWLAFNEPDSPVQANCTPQQAAQALRKLDEVLRGGNNPADPTAKIYCCGLVDARTWDVYLTDLRMAYVNTTGQNPPLDGVHLHLYNGASNRLDWCRLRNKLDGFRVWQQGQGWLASRPIIVSEYGVLSSSSQYPDDSQRIAGNCAAGCDCGVLAGMFDAFQQRSWVQTHLWWATYSDALAAPPGETWDTGNVFTDRHGSSLTDPVGLRYRELSR